MFGLIKGNQWVFIVPNNKAGYSLGGVAVGGGTLDSHDRLQKSKPLKNWCLEDDRLSFWGVKRPIFRGKLSVRFREGR